LVPPGSLRAPADPASGNGTAAPAFRRSGQQTPEQAEPDTTAWANVQVTLREISMFMGANWLITVHQEPIDELEEVQHRWQRNVEAITGQDVPDFGDTTPRPRPKKNGDGTIPGGPMENDIGILLYSLLDTIVDNYFPTIDALVDRVEALEEQIFERFDPGALESIFALKKDLLALRKVLAPERDVLNVLTRRDLPIFKTHTLVYFQDVYDHVVRITDSIDTYRDLLSSALDSYLSMQSNRLNITVQTLTSASIILMVLSMITGIYGTNFDNIPELHWTYGYFAMLGVMAAVALGLYAFFKRKGWL
jgi:magnesium transporter